jgi:poly-gamma-glutamate synthesis protein (capsule biosynthesis protein)
MPFVPVVNFWSTRTSISMDELRSEYAAGRVSVAAADNAAVAQALGVSQASSQAADSASVVASVKAGAMGVLRATDVVPSVRALGIGDVDLFGEKRISDIAQWPLTATVESGSTWEQSSTWTMVSVGDMQFDRKVRGEIDKSGKRSYPFDGGTSRVVAIRCCSFFHYQYPIVERTGNSGAVRDKLMNADFTMGNLETGVLVDAPWHPDPTGFQFTTDASWMQDLADNGFDALSTANNHSHDAGNRGLQTAIDSITAAGMTPLGSGDDGAALHPAYFDVHGIRMAIVACNAISSSHMSGAGLETLNCKNDPVASVVREARANADLVIVFPHWGVEYELPVGYQFELARQWIDAGADLIIGAHNHFPGGIYDYNGHVTLLSMGNFIFDQEFRQTTLQGLVPEMTFSGSQLMQLWPNPLLIVDTQPNFAQDDDDINWAYDVMKWESRPGRLDWGGTPAPNFGETPPK